jgi:glutamate 5-kinase
MSEQANLVRREIIDTAKTLVVKIGTNVLSRADGTLDIERIQTLAQQIHRIRQSGRQVVVVSSGSVGAGIGLLGLTTRPEDLPHLQAAAATGQAHLIHLYDECFRKQGSHAAQILVTANDFKNRTRYLNMRNTLYTLFEYDVIPIVNENDTVSIDEIKFGDNDHLGAMVANLLQCPLILLSVVDGLFDGDPNAADSRLISQVDQWDNSLLDLATDNKSSFGSGGMQSKLEAVRMTTAVGETVIMANGTQDDILDNILAGNEVGTLFLAKGPAVPAWKRWIGYTVQPKGQFILDAGARLAVEKSGRSLLAIGITKVQGQFTTGELVSLVDESGTEFARGLTNYNSDDCRLIAGRKTSDIADVLGGKPYSEVIHRDNLVVTL